MKHVKCVIIGDGAVGKTSMLASYVNNIFSEKYVPTVFENFDTSTICDDTPVLLSLWDTGGKADYDYLRPISYHNTDVFIICYSIANPESLENIRTKWVPEIINYSRDVPFIIVGTQSDLKNDQMELENHNHVSKKKVSKIANTLGAAAVMECSAKTQDNLSNVFDEVIRIWISIENNKTSDNGNCCILS